MASLLARQADKHRARQQWHAAWLARESAGERKRLKNMAVLGIAATGAPVPASMIEQAAPRPVQSPGILPPQLAAPSAALAKPKASAPSGGVTAWAKRNGKVLAVAGLAMIGVGAVGLLIRSRRGR